MRTSRWLILWHVAAVFAGFAAASFSIHLYLFYVYFSSHPGVRNLALGQVYPLSNHGAIVYLSRQEAACLSLLMAGFAFWLVGTMVVIPKAGIRRRLRHGRMAWVTDPDDPVPAVGMTVALAGLAYAAAIWKFGVPIARLAIDNGYSPTAW